MDVCGCRGRTGQVYIPDPLNMTAVFSSGTLSETKWGFKKSRLQINIQSRQEEHIHVVIQKCVSLNSLHCIYFSYTGINFLRALTRKYVTRSLVAE